VRRLGYLVRTLLRRRHFDVEVTNRWGDVNVLTRWPEKWMPDILAAAERSGSAIKVLRSY
jgi:hypothetical protein